MCGRMEGSFYGVWVLMALWFLSTNCFVLSLQKVCCGIRYVRHIGIKLLELRDSGLVDFAF